jgi:hypothetical protein
MYPGGLTCFIIDICSYSLSSSPLRPLPLPLFSLPFLSLLPVICTTWVISGRNELPVATFPDKEIILSARFDLEISSIPSNITTTAKVLVILVGRRGRGEGIKGEREGKGVRGSGSERIGERATIFYF